MSEREQRVEVGKRWVGDVFDALRKQYRDQVPIYHWIWKERQAGHVIRFLTTGHDDIQFVPSEHDGFTHDQLCECGDLDPANDPVRRQVENLIRAKLASLADRLGQS